MYLGAIAPLDTKPLRTAAPSSPKRRMPGKRGFTPGMLMPRFAAMPSLTAMLALCLAAIQAGAVGLGDMVLTSPPGQPLQAQIPVELVTAQELWALEVGIAEEIAFLRNGLDRAPEIDELSFEIVRDSEGGSMVRMSSPDPLASSMTILVEATWLRRQDLPPGRLIRIYSLGPDDLPENDMQPRPLGTGSLGTYGPVEAGERLWNLADRFSAPGVHPNQFLVAVFEANPRGFSGNMNGIYQGATLRIPEAVQARRLTVDEATAEAISQLDAWLADAGSRGQSALGGIDPADGVTPAGDELQADLDDTLQLLDSRNEELLTLREQLLEAQAVAEAAEEDAEAARAAIPPAPPPGLRGLWVELNRFASRVAATALVIGVGALVLIGILIGFLLGRRSGAGAQRPASAATSDTEGPVEASPSSEATGGAAESRATMDIESQMDLARAYIDMGDTAAARRTLRAVISAGNRAQRQQAESLIQELESPSEENKPDTADDQD